MLAGADERRLLVLEAEARACMLDELSALTTSAIIDYIAVDHGMPRKPLYAHEGNGKVELYAWTRLDGKELTQGLLGGWRGRARSSATSGRRALVRWRARRAAARLVAPSGSGASGARRGGRRRRRAGPVSRPPFRAPDLRKSEARKVLGKLFRMFEGVVRACANMSQR